MKLLGGNPHVLSLENGTNKMALQFVFIQKRPPVIFLYIHRRRLNYLCVAVWDFVWSVACMADWSFHVCYSGMPNPCIFVLLLLVWIFWSFTCMVLNMQLILSQLYFGFECMVACICTSIVYWNVRKCERKYSNMTMFVLPLTKGPRCFIEQETLLSLLSTGWFQGRIRAWFT